MADEINASDGDRRRPFRNVIASISKRPDPAPSCGRTGFKTPTTPKEKKSTSHSIAGGTPGETRTDGWTTYQHADTARDVVRSSENVGSAPKTIVSGG